MLKRLAILLVLLGFALSAASYFTGYFASFPAIIMDEKPVVSMSIQTDTEVYHSGEFMEAKIYTACNRDIDSAVLRIYGVKDRSGKYRVNEERIVEISPPGNETAFMVRMPQCYGCAGIEPGEYEIACELIYGDGVIGNATKTIKLEK